MQRMMTIMISSLALVASTTAGKAAPPTVSSQHGQLLVAEGTASSDGLTVTHGNVIVKNGRPGVAFAFVTKPGQVKEFTYFLVFNHNFPKGGVKTHSSSDGLKANTYHAISAFGNSCMAEYRITLKLPERTIKTESTVLADVPYDKSKGKVFLVDMEKSPPMVTQVKAALPLRIPDLRRTGATAAFVEKTLKKLRETDKSINAFCQQIESGT